jgi:hypothetical protein
MLALSALLSCLLALPAASVEPPEPLAGPRAVAGDDFDAAVLRLRRAGAGGTATEREAALAAVVAFADTHAVEALQLEFSTASESRRRSQDRILESTYALERKRSLFAQMELRAERDSSLEGVVRDLQREIGELEKRLQKDRDRVAERGEWCKLLQGGTSQLFGGFGKGKRRKAEGFLWKSAEDDDLELTLRLAAIEMLGGVGGPGAAVRLQKLLIEVEGDRRSLKRTLPRLEKKLHELEERMQREQEAGRGSTRNPVFAQYERERRESAAVRGRVHTLAFLVDAAAEAGGEALDREAGEPLDKSLTTLAKALLRTKGTARLKALDLFRHSESDATADRLRALLAGTEEPLLRAELIDALATLGDRSVIPALTATHLADESWIVRSRAASALASLRAKDGIPALIARLEAEEGRLRTDVASALASLTGQKFGSRAELWARWWADNGDAFEVPAEAPELEASLTAKEALGVTFFGVKTESQRVLFVLDVSGSMNFSMVPRDNPDDSQGRPFDMPRDGEDSRLAVAKRELRKALGGIRNGGSFSLVLYASDVWGWEDELVEMDDETRGDVLRYVDGLTAVGGTNLFGALEHAFAIVGVEEGEEWSAPLVDTIFLLSDGRPSVGVTTDPDQILEFVRELNRSAGITLHTIGLSGAQDAYLLHSLAEQNGGRYVAR